MSTKRVKAIGCIDFTLAVATIVLIAYRVIIPLYPLNGTDNLKATKSPPKFRIREWEEGQETRPPIKPVEFWFIVGVFGIIGVMGLAWSLVLIKVAVYPDIRTKFRVQLLGFWLLCNGIILAFMISLGIWLFANGPMDHEDDEVVYSTQIPFLICFLLRLILVYAIWKERLRMLVERRSSNEEIDKWLRYLAGYKPPKHGHPV